MSDQEKKDTPDPPPPPPPPPDNMDKTADDEAPDVRTGRGDSQSDREISMTAL